MAISKRYKKVTDGLDRDKSYTVEEAVKLIKARATAKKRAAWIAADDTRPALVETISLLAYDKGGFWASMDDALGQWGSLTAGQEAAVRRIFAQDAARKAERAHAAQRTPLK